MKVITIIQARTTSSRLPNKVLLDLYGKCLLERVIDQANGIKKSDEVWVATSVHENDDIIEYLCDRRGIPVYRGSLLDVRWRYYHIARQQKADIIVRITADNPFTEPEFADELIDSLINNSALDYARMDKSLILDGSHSEVFTMKALEKSIREFDDDQNREHVTQAMIRHMNVIEVSPSNNDLISKTPYFIGIDTFEDFKRCILLYKKFGANNTLKHLIKEINTYGKAI
jgi:spore coat polysaccharide biosynthesis protein SpsF